MCHFQSFTTQSGQELEHYRSRTAICVIFHYDYLPNLKMLFLKYHMHLVNNLVNNLTKKVAQLFHASPEFELASREPPCNAHLA